MKKTLIALLLLALPALAQDPGQKTFGTPDEAAKALVAACASDDTQALVDLVGSRARSLVATGIAEQDTAHRKAFVAASQERMQLVPVKDNLVMMQVGQGAHPLSLPLVKKGQAWFFDGQLGLEEMRARRVGRNELLVMRTLREYVQAQREYAALDPDRSGLYQYAQRLVSSTGKHDGLFWPVPEGSKASPLGPLMAQAEGPGKPFHGYRFRILTRQGPSAPGGAYNYLVNGHLVAGFGILAWPAEYGQSGIMTFMVGPSGVIYEKDLKGSEAAQKVDSFNPGNGWKRL